MLFEIGKHTVVSGIFRWSRWGWACDSILCHLEWLCPLLASFSGREGSRVKVTSLFSNFFFPIASRSCWISLLFKCVDWAGYWFSRISVRGGRSCDTLFSQFSFSSIFWCGWLSSNIVVSILGSGSLVSRSLPNATSLLYVGEDIDTHDRFLLCLFNSNNLYNYNWRRRVSRYSPSPIQLREYISM